MWLLLLLMAAVFRRNRRTLESSPRTLSTCLHGAKHWEDPESPDNIADFRAMVGRLGERPLAIGPLDGRNGSAPVYAVGSKSGWKVHFRRARDVSSASSEVEAALAAILDER